MRRADRLFQIVQGLRGGRLVTASQMAERLEVSKRTIYRDIGDLIGSGVPIEGEAGVGYVMRTGYEMPPLMFDQDEIVALVAGARLIRAWGGAHMALAAEEALVKIEAVLPENAKERLDKVGIHAAAPFLMEEDTRQFLDEIERAEYLKLRLQFDYSDEAERTSQRVVQPLGLFFWGKTWTLIAWCELREDFRSFRVDRIQSIKTLNRFQTHPDRSLKTYFQRDLCGDMPPSIL